MEGVTKSECTLMSMVNVNCTKGRMANSMLWPCGLSCQLLGLHHNACLSNKLVQNHLLWARPHPAQLLFYVA